MSAFDQLKEISNNFEQQLHQISSELFSARIGEPFEDVIIKKLQDLMLLNSKLRFIQAKEICAQSQVSQLEPDEIIKQYGEVATQKVLEQVMVKSLTQTHTVKCLITTPDDSLDPVLLERKQKIIASLYEYRQQETRHCELVSLYRERQHELSGTRAEWDRQLGLLRAAREQARGGENEAIDNTGPMYKKLASLVDKLELMRWLSRQLVTSRGQCDWLADTKRTMHALKLTRTPNTIEMFTE